MAEKILNGITKPMVCFSDGRWFSQSSFIQRHVPTPARRKHKVTLTYIHATIDVEKSGEEADPGS